MTRAPSEENMLHFTNPSEESDDEFDDYLPQRDVSAAEYNNILDSVYQEDYQEEEEEQHGIEFEKEAKQKQRYIHKERIYLDVAMYTISGIIMIFIMEQFIQIGMKIKSTI